MASKQCYKPTNETYQQKCHETSMGQKVSEMGSWALKGNHQGSQPCSQGYGSYGYSQTQAHSQYPAQSYSYSQTQAQYPAQSYSYSQAQAQYPAQSYPPNQGLSQTQSSYCYSQTQKENGGILKAQTECVSETLSSNARGQHRHRHATNGVASSCQGRPNRRRNLFQKVKDGMSGNSSGDSSSESDDDDTCRRRKN